MAVVDLSGQRFGRLFVIERAGSTTGRQATWLCRCDCGEEAIVSGSDLRRGNTRSCGCLHRDTARAKLHDLSGRRFGKLTVISRAENEPGRRNARWLCRCDCGAETVVPADRLTGSKAKSCGCAARNRAQHGHTVNAKRSPTYQSWRSMIRRCTVPTASDWEHYGGRGITICDRWLGEQGFENFLADMGERPDWATGGIDRIDNDGDYEPGNCRWATPKEQAANRRQPRAAA